MTLPMTSRGTLRCGQELRAQERLVSLSRLFLLMGRFLQEVAEAPAGSIVAMQLSSVEGSELGGAAHPR